MGFTYRSPDDFWALGQRVRDTAIRVTLTHDNQYGFAQQDAVNYPYKVAAGQQAPMPGYHPSGSEDPTDDDLKAFVNAEFAEVPTWFINFALPNPDDCQPMVEALYRTAATLEQDLVLKAGTGPNRGLTASDDKVYPCYPIGDSQLRAPVSSTAATINMRLTHWNGAAADAFKTYLGLFDKSATRQRNLAISLALVLQARLEINRRVITDIWNLGETAVKALDDLDGWHCPERGGAAMTFTVLGSVAAILATVASTETGIGAIALGIIEGTQGVGSVLSTGAPYTSQQALAGGTVPAVLQSVQQKMSLVQQWTGDQQSQLTTILDKLAAQLDEVRHTIMLPMPLGDLNLDGATRTDLDKPDGTGPFYDR